MQKKYVLLTISLLCYNLLFAGDTIYMGARLTETFQGNYTFFAPRQVYNTDNEKLITGGFAGNIVINNDTLISGNIRSGFIAAKDSTGNLKWAKKIEGAGYNQVNASLAQKDGWLVAGVFSDTISPGGTELISGAYQSVFLLKTNNTGDPQWAKKFDVPPLGGKQFIIEANKSTFYFATEFTGEFSYGDSVYSSPDKRSVLILKLKQEGEIEKVMMIKSHSSLQLNVAEPIPGGRLMLGINFNDTTTVGNHVLVNSGHEDFFLATLNRQMRVQRIKQSSGYGAKRLKGAVKHQGGFVLYGEYRGGFSWEGSDFTKSPGNQIFMLKVAGNGNLRWKQSITGYSHKNAVTIVCGPDDQLYLWANFRGKLEFMDEELASESFSYQWFIARFSKQGQPEWIAPANNPKNFTAEIYTGTKPGKLSLLGSNRHNNQTLFEKSLDSLAKETFFMELFDCEYANKSILPPDTIFCGSGMLDGGDGYSSYLWSSGGQEQFLEVSHTGVVYLEATDIYGCKIKDSVYVEVLPDFSIAITGNDKICPHEGNTMLMINTDASVTWSTGDTGPVIFVNQAGEYHADATNSDGCSDEASFTVTEYATTLPDLWEYYMITPGQALELYPGEYVSYNWTGGYHDSVLVINGSDYDEGTYNFHLEVTDFNDCLLTHEFIVDIYTTTANSWGITDDPEDERFDPLDPKDLSTSEYCDFVIYPNPGAGPFYLHITSNIIESLNDIQGVNIELFIWDVQGNLVLKEKLEENINPYKINSTGFNPGKYLVAIVTDKKICEIKKLIVVPTNQ